MTRANPPHKNPVPVSLVVLAGAFLLGIILALYGYAQDRAMPLAVGLGMSVVGGVFGAIRISLWGDNR